MAPQSRSKRTKVRGNPLKTQSRAGLTHMNTALPGAAKILNGGFRLDVATTPSLSISGLGHVPLLVSMMTGAQSLGVEVQAAYVASGAKVRSKPSPQPRPIHRAGRARCGSVSRHHVLSVFAFQRLHIGRRAERAAKGEYAQVHKDLVTRSLHPQSFE
jgi:hypothetical protein